MKNPVRIEVEIFIKVGSSPHENFCIPMLELRRRSIIKSDLRLSGDCKYEDDNVTAVQIVYSLCHGRARQSSTSRRRERVSDRNQMLAT